MAAVQLPQLAASFLENLKSKLWVALEKLLEMPMLMLKLWLAL